MKKWFLVIGLAVVMAVSAFAQVFDFTSVNNTGYAIDEIYLSPSDDDEWGDDILELDVLADGESVEFEFDPDMEELFLAFGVDLYDMRCVYEDGSTDEWYELKLEEIDELTLTLDAEGNGVESWE